MIAALWFVLKQKIDDWAFPEFSGCEYYVGNPDKCLLISFDLKGRALEIAQVLNLEARGVMRYRRSRWLPWRKYGYVVLGLERSPYHYLVKTPRFIQKDGSFLGEWETAEMIRDSLLKAYDQPYFEPVGKRVA